MLPVADSIELLTGRLTTRHADADSFLVVIAADCCVVCATLSVGT